MKTTAQGRRRFARNPPFNQGALVGALFVISCQTFVRVDPDKPC